MRDDEGFRTAAKIFGMISIIAGVVCIAFGNTVGGAVGALAVATLALFLHD